MKSWVPALAALAAAGVAATVSGMALSGLSPGAGGASPVVLKSVTPGSLEARHIRLTHAPLPVECTPAGWLHVALPGRCPVSQSAAEATARASLPVFKAITLPLGGSQRLQTSGSVASVPAASSTVVREAALAWADVPASATPTRQAMRAMVWVIAVDEQVPGMTACAPSRAQAMAACGRASRYLVFIDALSAKLRFLMSRP